MRPENLIHFLMELLDLVEDVLCLILRKLGRRQLVQMRSVNRRMACLLDFSFFRYHRSFQQLVDLDMFCRTFSSPKPLLLTLRQIDFSEEWTFPSLNIINLEMFWCSNVRISLLHRLVDLTISSIHGLGIFDFSSFSCLTKLSLIDTAIANVEDIVSKSLLSLKIINLSFVGRLITPSLQELTLAAVDSADSIFLSSDLPRLYSLRLELCPITDISLKQVTSQLTHLHVSDLEIQDISFFDAFNLLDLQFDVSSSTGVFRDFPSKITRLSVRGLGYVFLIFSLSLIFCKPSFRHLDASSSSLTQRLHIRVINKH